MEDKNNDSIIDQNGETISPNIVKKNTFNLTTTKLTLLVFIPLLIICMIIAFTIGINIKSSSDSINSQNLNALITNTPILQTATASPTTTITIEGLTLDINKNYGNKYANGILPVGDNKYTMSAKKGNIYLCNPNFQEQGGAGNRGPWFVNNNTEWDINKKLTVSGNVTWQPNITVSFSNGKRIIKTNDLPNHKTGVFPIAQTDPVHKYDANPNKISTQSLTYTLDENPTYSTPHCLGGEAGIMLTGVALFDGFDAGGRDAGAWEVQDGCDGHPQVTGEYHYHTLSRCITDQSVDTVLGFALDGFPITGPKVGANNILTTDDLDECHGITSEINLDGKKVTMYHYVMTQDFPYSVSCFRANAIQPPNQGQQNNMMMNKPK